TSLPMANFRVVTPGYFEALAVAVPEGRAFEPWDRADSQPVGLINQTLAEQLWPGEEALGKRIDLFGDEGHRFTVVGVVGDVRQHDLAEPASPEIYWPLSQSSEFGVRSLAILLRTQGPPLELAAAARQTLRSLDPYVPITEVTSLPQVLDAQVAEPRLIAMTMSSFALLALVLGMTGVFGVVSCAVAGRVREIGIRMALGAARDAVVREVLAGGLRLVVAGLAIGLAVAAAIARTLQRYLFAVEPGSLPIHGATVLAILLAALLALWLPARRASSVDPTIALRHE
ncbi:MAG: ABC transporter permease, partial [Acidobacteriota bacterium]